MCAECKDFPCEKYNGFFDWDSFISHKVCRSNIEQIKKAGLKIWLTEQIKRRTTLENLLANWNEGRSCSFYCIATALIPINLIKEAVKRADKMVVSNKAGNDIKVKAKILRSLIQDLVSKSGVDLKLRKKQKGIR